jgi:uncharacterized membrane protein YphA (DoxX/SURF4 family)
MSPDASRHHAIGQAFIMVVLRLTLGLSLLEDGIRDFLQGAVRRGAWGYNAYFSPYNMPSRPGAPNLLGWEAVTQWLPYLEVAIGVAVTLGFFTTIAATAAALWPVGIRIVTVAFLLVAAPVDPAVMNSLGPMGILEQAAMPSLLMALGVIWLSTSGVNPASLDALMRRRSAAALTGRTSPPQDVSAPPSG